MYYFKEGDQVVGPITKDELRYFKTVGRVVSETYVRYGEDGPWKRVGRNCENASLEKEPIPASAAHLAGDSTDAESDQFTPAARAEIPSESTQVAQPDLSRAQEQPSPINGQIFYAAATAAILLLIMFFFWDEFTAATNRGGSAGDAVELAGTTNESSTNESSTNESSTNESSTKSPASQPRPDDVEKASNEPQKNPDPDEAGSLRQPQSNHQSGILAGDAHSKFTISLPSDASFFGVSASGRHFAFVVDHSGSMEGTPLERAKEELLASINRLPDEVTVHIVFFSSVAYPDPHGVRVLSSETKKDLSTWIGGVSIAGGTSPFCGIQQALKATPTPDVVFLLTDGAFESGEVSAIAGLNSVGASINTVALTSRSGESLLREIAEQNDGDYRFVP